MNENLLNAISTFKSNQLLNEYVLAINSAYELIENLSNNELFLKTPVGKDIKPHLKRAAVDFFLYTLSKRFPHKLTSSYAPNKAKNCSHIQLDDGQFIFTASYVKNSSDLPREALFRDDLIDLNYSLFECKKESEKIYMVLTHGGHRFPNFINFKIPSKGRLHYTIELDTSTILGSKVEQENTDFNIDLEIKNFVNFQKEINEK